MISVICNFYNAGSYIEETIQSVLNQPYQDWELILIDDGSNDKSTHIAQQYVEKFPGKFFIMNMRITKIKVSVPAVISG